MAITIQPKIPQRLMSLRESTATASSLTETRLGTQQSTSSDNVGGGQES